MIFSKQKKVPNQQYNVAKAQSISVKIAAYQRKKMFDLFLAQCDPSGNDRLLDVGVTSDTTYEASNYLEAWYKYKNNVVAVGIDDASFLEELYPGMKFVMANGLDLPFEDRSFDIVHSSAVLEHVGSEEKQVQFVRECARVAKRAFFITTPNRWFPIEFHTVLPLIHWLPKNGFRYILRNTGYDFFSLEENLNLIGRRDLNRISSSINEYGISIHGVRLLGIESNIILCGVREGV